MFPLRPRDSGHCGGRLRHLSIPNFELLLRRAGSRRAAQAWGGVPGYAIAALLGLHSESYRVSRADWPLLADPSGPGSIIANPASALRNWLTQVATGVSSSGPAVLAATVELSPSVTVQFASSTGRRSRFGASGNPRRCRSPDQALTRIHGPCRFSLARKRPICSSGWSRPPAGELGKFASRAANSATDFPTLLSVLQPLAPFVASLPDAVQVLDGPDAGLTGLSNLANFLASSDGA